MLLLSTLALATVPEHLADRRVGIGVEVPITGLPLPSSSAMEQLFTPRFNGRFQFGRLGLAPHIGVELQGMDFPGVESRAWFVSGGLDARAYPASMGPVHLVGVAGVSGTGSLDRIEPDGWVEKSRFYRMDLNAGAGVEWTPSPRFSLSAEAQTSVLSLAYGDPVDGWYKQWNAGLGTLSPKVGVHVWF